MTRFPLKFMKEKEAATTAAVPFHWCTLLELITEKAYTFVNLSRVKSHHLLCPGFGFAFIARIFCHIVFTFHMFLQSLIGGAPVLTLWTLDKISSVFHRVLLKRGKPFARVVALVTHESISSTDMLALDVTLQGPPILQNLSTFIFSARNVLIKMLFVIVPL